MTEPLPPLRINVPAHQAWLGEQELKLSVISWKLLLALASSAGRMVSSNDLAKAVVERRLAEVLGGSL